MDIARTHNGDALQVAIAFMESNSSEEYGTSFAWNEGMPINRLFPRRFGLPLLECEGEGGCGANVGDARMRLCRVVLGLQEVWEVTEVAVECRQAKKWKGPWPASRDAVGMSGEPGATAGAARS